MNRAFTTTFVLKNADDSKRELEGLCSTEDTDRQGDQIVPLGATIKTPLPFCWEHGAVIGNVIAAKATAAGVWITAKIPRIGTPGKTRDRIEECWTLIRERLVRHLSVGFRPIGKPTPIAGGGLRYGKWELLEVSACLVPSNPSAEIQVVRSLARAAQSAGSRELHPGSVFLADIGRRAHPRSKHVGSVYLDSPGRGRILPVVFVGKR